MDTTRHPGLDRFLRTLLPVLGLLAARAGAQCTSDWVKTPGFGFGGVNGTVLTSIMWDPDGAGLEPEWLVVGGMFPAAGDVAASCIVAWDGAQWHSFQGGVTEGFIFDRVSALAVYDGMLIVGGHFAMAGDVPVENIAAYDGTEWHALGGGVYGGFSEPEVSALAVFNGTLVAAGAFLSAGNGPADFIAAWDGTDWSPLGAGVSFAVMSLATHQGDLFVGGQFSSAGNNVPQTAHLARWDGSAWSSVGGGANSFVQALHSQGADLYIGGNFNVIGNVVTTGVAKWDGSQFEALGGGIPGMVTSLGFFGGDLHVGGQFLSAGGQAASNIARWDGAAWHGLGEGVDDIVWTTTDMNDWLFVGGRFRDAGGDAAAGMALWDGQDWASFEGRPLDVQAGGLSVFGDDLIVSGYAAFSGGGRLSSVLRFDGLEWSPMGGPFNELVWDTGVHDGDLYAVGWFTQVDGNSAVGVARWSGSEWTGVGADLTGGYVTSALCMGSYQGDLIIAGDFQGAGGVAANHIARWGGGQWSPLGSGIGDDYAFVWEVLQYQGDLVAVGEFGIAGGAPASNVARWDGAAWHPLGDGLTGGFLPGANAATIFEGDLIVGGNFTLAGDGPAMNIARWDGTQWRPMGAGIPDHGVVSLGVYNGRLYAGGEFNFSDESNTRILVWDGATWEIVGGGVNSSVSDIQPYQSELILAGGFSIAGETVAPGLARWTDTHTPWFATQPADAGACLGDDAGFTATLALGYEDATLQWRHDASPLSDGPTGHGSTISGATTGMLSIAGVHAADAGSYDCVAENACATAPSSPATLTVCTGDFNCDGTVNTLDVLAFLNAWTAGDPRADIDGDGLTNTLDVLAFLNAWAGGC